MKIEELHPLGQKAAERMADLIIAKIESLPPLMAVAIHYQSGQPQPALYLAYDTVESNVARLLSEASNAKTKEFEDSIKDWPEQDASRWRLRRQVGLIFDTGYWANPADCTFNIQIDTQTIGDFDPVIAAWANPAFQTYSDMLGGEADSRPFAQHIRDILWLAIDETRKRSLKTIWPPLLFVHNFDDEAQELLQTIAQRAPLRP